MKTKTAPNILWFKDIDHNDLDYVGGKGANLGEMYKIKIPVPNGFVVTAQAYFKFIKENNLMDQIKKILKSANTGNPDELLSASKKIRKIIKNSSMPDDIAIDIMKAYKKLSKHGGLTNVPVAVRSSATAEDLPDASFAGQQDTFLNVVGEANVVKRVQACWSSLFTPRAIFYRENKHFNHFKVGIAVPVQKMVQADISGVMFTVNPVSNEKTQIIVESVWGLGEYIVQGKVTPEQYIINKHSWTIESFIKSIQKIQLIKSKNETKEVKVPKYKQNHIKINDKTAIKIAKIGQKLHNHYAKAQDIEFAIEKGKIYIVQTRPITTLNQKIDKTQITIPEDILGDAASPGITSGKVVILKTPKNISKIKKGDILVSPMTSPDFVPAMKKANGIITDKGGQTSHAAIVSRELGTPCVVGAKIATKKLKNGDIVTLDGSTGKIWFGNLVPSITDIPKDQFTNIKTATKIYVNLGEPDLAKDISLRHVDGVGLLRAEFMIANIGIHPKHIIATKKQSIYINKLAKDIGTFCKHFSPRPVIYRATDFKTNEYRHLKWGKSYEPEESNPMLGYRGAGRYITSPDVFEMELTAIKKVRNKLGFKNLWLMIPFVRTVQELVEVKKIIATNGLLRSPSFKLLMMVEIPSNVILLNKFIDVGIDGISIGSNDLTMLTLGLDRDNSEVAKDFNELDPAVIWMLKRAITTAKKRGITSSICGQAPSNYPSLVEKLVKWGVTSISVSPDAIQSTRQTVHWAENRKLK
ncbi:phosphoenolpyruvate synthase [Patescibacteria group bacterium]|nr:phosphoenolpyruvate synthase [Patescibacteria group bacterium]